MKKYFKKLLVLAFLVLPNLYLSNVAQADSHPDGGALVYRAYGVMTDPDTGGPVQGGVLDGSYSTPLYNGLGNLVGKVDATATTLEFTIRKGGILEGGLTINSLDVFPSWLTISETTPPLVIPMDQVADSNVPNMYRNDNYELVVFTGRVENFLGDGFGILRNASCLEFRCSFICRKIPGALIPGFGPPVFSLNRLYSLS